MALSKGEYERIRKLTRLLKDHSAVSKAGLIAKYKDKYVSKGRIINGKYVEWDERTGEKFDPSSAWNFLNLEKFGTETPQADLKYLRAKDLQIRKEKGAQYNDPIRAKLSRKLIVDEDNPYDTVYGKEQATRIQKDRTKLNELRKATSFARLNNPDQADIDEINSIEAGQQETRNKLKALPPNNNPSQTGLYITRNNEVSGINDASSQKQKEKAPAALGTDPYKTDVFTVDPRTGKEVGVITRNQRKELESYLAKNKLKAKRSPGLYIQSTR